MVDNKFTSGINKWTSDVLKVKGDVHHMLREVFCLKVMVLVGFHPYPILVFSTLEKKT